MVFIVSFGIVMVGAAALLIYLLAREARRESIRRSLGLQLFLVTLPQEEDQADIGIEQIRQKISLMEKVFSTLEVVKDSKWHNFLYGRPAIALELSVAHIGEEVSFYIALPRHFSLGIEKAIQGIFPHALVEPVKDYNIFNPSGAASGAILNLSRDSSLPIRTYMNLESDPLRELTNSFSKLAREGEGAVLQLILRKAPKKVASRIRQVAKRLHQGKSLREATQGESTFSKIASDLKSNSPNKDSKPERKELTPQEQEMVRLIEGKASHPLFQVNLRLLTSADTESRAREILRSLEAAFSQFSDPTFNRFNVRESKGRRLKQLIYNFSFRIFRSRESLILSSEELTSLYHFPNIATQTPKVKMLKARQAPPPADTPSEGLLLGYNYFRGQKTDVYLTREDRRRHLYIVGQTGTGKSVFLKEMIRQDIQGGEGLCFVDPHGDSAEEVLQFVPPERMKDVIYFNPGDIERPFGLNFLEYDPAHPEQKTFIVNELFDIFKKIWSDVPEAFGPMFEQYFRNSTLLVMEDPSSGNTLYEIQRVLVDKAFRDRKISQSQNVVVNSFWRDVAEKAGGEASLQNMVPYISSKFDVFLANEFMRPILLQERSTFNFRDILDSRKILIVNLSKGRLGEMNSYLLGLIIVGKLLMAALSRGVDIPEQERKDFYLYIDEFQNVTTKSIATILSEARKYRLGLIITHQFIGQLEEGIKNAVFGNVGSMISFRVGSDDGEFLEKQFKPVFGAQDLINLDNFNCYAKILINGKTSQAFSMLTYPQTGGDASIAAQVKEQTRLNYGRPRHEVEDEIRSRKT